jgi:hypothetical protein
MPRPDAGHEAAVKNGDDSVMKANAVALLGSVPKAATRSAFYKFYKVRRAITRLSAKARLQLCFICDG